jgi:DNA (cytosine-5)-methyltransferase 1
MNQSGKYVAPDMENPSPVVSTQGRLGVVHTEFLSKYYSGKPEHKNLSVDGPAHTIKPIDSHALVQPEFMASYYGNGDNVRSTDQPAGTLTTKDRIALVQPCFIYRDFGSTTNSDVESPAGAITSSPKLNLVSCDPFIMDTAFNNGPKEIENPLPTITANRKWHYLVNPQWFNQVPGSIEQPAPTLIARMDKAPPYLVTTETGHVAIECYQSDSEMTLKIKEFMAMYGIAEIKMRMLYIDELKLVQGFPSNYTLLGNQAQQKKYIGNSVVPIVVTKMAEALISANYRKWEAVA